MYTRCLHPCRRTCLGQPPTYNSSSTFSSPIFMLRRALVSTTPLLTSTLYSPRITTRCMSTKRPMVKIGTHSGAFHCDEALGCFLLKQLDQFKDAEVVRTRDSAVLKEMDVVVDVGGVYDPATLRFDHHQREFADVFGHGFATRLSSAGLVYKHFGKDIIAHVIKSGPDAPEVHLLWLAVYKHFMEAVDAIDNGVNQWEGDAPPRYINSTHLSARVGALNPTWHQDQSDDARLQAFAKAMELTGREFLECVEYYAQSWLPARAFVEAAMQKRTEVDASGRILLLEQVVPWKEHLYVLEKEHGIEGSILYVLYKDPTEGKFRIQAVSAAEGSFASRKALPTPWRGLRDEALSEVCGVPGGVFVHASGFIGGNATYEGALAMARKALVFQEGMTDELVGIST